MLHFLVTNDDGIQAEGIQVLAEALAHYGRVTVIGPDQERSGYSHSFTVQNPLMLKKARLPWPEAISYYAINGTPVDATRFGLQILLKDDRPDFIFTGINAGSNLGQDYYYSGTIGAAREGALQGIRSVACSLSRAKDLSLSYEGIQKALHYMIQQLIEKDFPADCLMNLNFPAEIQTTAEVPVKICPMNLKVPKFTYKTYQNPKGQDVYWLTNQVDQVVATADHDLALNQAGYITLSPMNLYSTAHSHVDKFKKWFEN